VQLVVAEALLN